MYSIVAQNEYNKKTHNSVTEFVADDENDVSELPTVTQGGMSGTVKYGSVAPGSSCHVLSDNKLYRLSPSGQWAEI